MKKILSIAVLLIASAVFGQSVTFNTGSAGDKCCGLMHNGSTPSLLATGCYTGSGVDNRKIASGLGLAEDGLLVIAELTAESGNNNTAVYAMNGLGAGVSCAYTNADFDPSGTFSPCGTNRVKAFGEDYFQIGTAAEVNTAGRVYCWQQWAAKAGYHGTVVYTGNGSSPRTIAITAGSTPAAAMVWAKVNSSSSDNIPWIRTADMPANTSFPAAQFATADSVQRIRDFSAGGIVVGSESNANGVEYHLAWWAEDADQEVLTYTGNGTSLDAGRCGSKADTQTINTTCSPVRSVLLAATQGTAGTCTLTRIPRCDHWRTTATGYSVVGPGNISNSDDLYAYKATQPNNSGPGLIGTLGNTSFQITGGPNLVSSCNDLNIPYYGLVTCANGPTVGQENAANWSFDTRLIYWAMEDASSSTRLNNNPTLGPCGTDCNLTNTDTVLKDTTLFKQGTASAGYNGGTDRLSCSLATCNEIKAVTTTLSVGGWVRPGAAADFEIMESESGQTQFRLFYRNASTAVRFTIRDTTSFDWNATGAGGSAGNGVWTHAVGTWEDAGTNTEILYTNGVAGSPVNPTNSMLAIGNGTFEVGGGNPTGNVDEVFVFQGVLTATDVCRIHACGWDGLQCSCFASDPTTYVNTGRWTGTCTLPACNKAAPS